MLRVRRFRVQNYRNIDDSGWIPVERVKISLLETNRARRRF